MTLVLMCTNLTFISKAQLAAVKMICSENCVDLRHRTSALENHVKASLHSLVVTLRFTGIIFQQASPGLLRTVCMFMFLFQQQLAQLQKEKSEILKNLALYYFTFVDVMEFKVRCQKYNRSSVTSVFCLFIGEIAERVAQFLK